jgi:hypothetical protein
MKSFKWGLRTTHVGRWGFISVTLILNFSCPNSKAEPYKEPRHKQLGKAYGYLYGQSLTLDRIKNEFPALRAQANLAEIAFKASPFGDTRDGLVSEFEELLGSQFPNEDASSVFPLLEKQVAETLQSQSITPQLASNFLEIVQGRAKGEIDPEIRSVLLSASPRLKRNPSTEIAEGLVTKFSSRGHPKSKGRVFSISIPYSWSSREGNRPNIIQVFQNGAGHGPLQCMVGVHQIPKEISGSEFLDFIENGNTREIIQDGATLIRSNRVTLDGAPAMEIVSNLEAERVGIRISTRTLQYFVFEDSHYFLIQFFIALPDGSSSELDSLEAKNLGLLKAIAASFVILDKY